MAKTKEPFGTTPLPTSDGQGNPVKIWFDPDAVASVAQQPQSQQIAVYEATPNEDCINGNMLDVNQHFCVYAVKNGLIRVLHRHSALRALLRGHAGQQITDIQFFLDGDVLGTVGHSAEKSTILVWRVFEQASDIGSETLLEVSTSSFTMERLIWHPFNPNQFWMIHSTNNDSVLENGQPKTMVATLVETTKIQTTTHPTANHAICEVGPDCCIMEGAVQISSPSGAAFGSSLTDLCWSGRDSRNVLTVHDSGEIVLWDLKHFDTDSNGNNGLPSGSSNGTSRPAIIAMVKEDIPQSRCFFLPHENTIIQQPVDSVEGPPTITTCFATGALNNTVITLWSSFPEGGPPPSKLQVLSLEEASPSYVIDLCFGPAPQDASPPSCFVLVGDRHKGQLMAFHVQSKWNKGEGSQKKALCVGSDYVVPFVQKHPVYSWSVVCSPTTDISEEELQEQAGLIFDMKLFAYQSKVVQCLTLTSYTCLPCEHSWSESTPGVRVEPIMDSAPASNGGSTPDQLELPNGGAALNDAVYDEEYDVDDEDEDSVGAREEISAPDPASLPVPNMNGTDAASSNPFANWLGAIAAQGQGPPGPAPAPAPIGLRPTTMQPPGFIPTNMSSSPMPAPSAPNVQQLLSPMDILNASLAAAPAPESMPAPPGNVAEVVTPSKAAKKDVKKVKKTPSRSKSPPAVKSKKGKKDGSKSDVKSPFPDGKISILRPNRDEKQSEAAAPAPAPSAPPTPVSIPLPRATAPVAAGAASGAPIGVIEDMVVRCLDMQFDKQQTFITSQVKSAVKDEVEKKVIPAMHRILKDQMSSSVIRPIQSSVDKLTQAGVKVNKKEFAAAVAGSAEEPVRIAMASSIRTMMIPCLESIAGQITKQLVEQMPKPAPPDTKTAEQITEMTNQIFAMSAAMEKMSVELKQLQSVVASSQAAASAQGVAMGGVNPPQQQQQQQQWGARSTPPPQMTQAELMEVIKNETLFFLQQRKYEDAFTKALSATTAEMTVFCCSQANVNDVLGGPSPSLSHPILLCLMQQLGASLVTAKKTDFRVELDWLQEIALTMNPLDPSIQKHVANILQQLVSNINTKMAQNDPNLRRPLHILLQVIRGMKLG